MNTRSHKWVKIKKGKLSRLQRYGHISDDLKFTYTSKKFPLYGMSRSMLTVVNFASNLSLKCCYMEGFRVLVQLHKSLWQLMSRMKHDSISSCLVPSYGYHLQKKDPSCPRQRAQQSWYLLFKAENMVGIMMSTIIIYSR